MTTELVVPGMGVAGTEALTGKQLRLKPTVKTEQQAQAELGKLLQQSTSGRRPDPAVTVAVLLEQHMTVAELDVTTRESYEGYKGLAAA